MLDKEKTIENIFNRLSPIFRTQNTMAEYLKLSPSVLTSWRKGRMFPTIDTLVMIADALECSVDELLIRRK